VLGKKSHVVEQNLVVLKMGITRFIRSD